MKVALVTIGDRGDTYYPHMWQSLVDHVDYGWHDIVHVDDRDHKLGMAGAVRAGWEAIGDDIDFVFHVEEDFVFRSAVDIDKMAETLYEWPHLAQLVLKRQPWSQKEREAGGIIECHPNDYCQHWQPWPYVEHRRIFSLNPCLIPRDVIDLGWPDGNEDEFTRLCRIHGYSFGFWGDRRLPPQVEHIGYERGAGWRL